MSTTLSRPTGVSPPAAAPPGRTPPPQRTEAREDLLMVATMVLLVAACLPLARVFVGLAFFRPVLGAMLLALGLAWGSRRLGAGPLLSLVVSVAGWFAFIAAAFLGDTLWGGVLPTRATVAGVVALWARGLLLVQLRPAPAFAEAGLMLLTVSGVWAITHAVEGLVFRLAAPLKAIVVALLLWVVPLIVAPETARAWMWAVPFLAAAALLLLSFAGTDLRRWGAWAPPGHRSYGNTEHSLLPTGAVLAIVAIVAGTVLAGVLPGFGDKPWYEVRGTGGTTLTTNPIVDIRSRLVARDNGPVMRVTAERPVYLRTTALDLYSASEEWTNSGIRASAVAGGFPPEVPMGDVGRVRVHVEVQNLPQAVLVPAPYQAVSVSGPLAEDFRYDRSNSTVTLVSGKTLERGDAYSIVAEVPTPEADVLDSADVSTDPSLRALPDNVPDQVGKLARSIVDGAGATSPFQQALAIQNELRSWKYSTEPPQGHGGAAMLTFIRNRIGYCEQYAGTMAVMLRELNLPARVAVGFTPGNPVTDEKDTYSVSNANAHSWVEVLFDEIGWVAFEPTPRSDGNVLVPSAVNVAPAQTVAQPRPETPAQTPRGEEAPEVPQDPSLRNQPERRNPGADAAPRAGDRSGAGRGGEAASSLPWVLAGLLGTAVLVGGAATAQRRRTDQHRPPLERVLRARTSVEHLGRGMGLSPAAWETDREYLLRVAHRFGAPAREAAEALAIQIGRARYALELPEHAADGAEAAAASLRSEMLHDRGPVARRWISARGRASTFAAVPRRRLAQRSSSSRRRAASK